MATTEENILKSKKKVLRQKAKKATAYIVLYGKELSKIENQISDVDCKLSNVKLQIKKALR
tara:strand:+ start:414 stop:596 length:183 start_codon:yes stop_codon:yes gene_type:complete